jgi:type VI secretion system protein ImpM
MTGQAGPGFYGKFPELGDFVNRRLPRAFLDPWDEWLQSAIAISREQLADKWLDLYLNAPVWCFVLSGGLCGELPWAGLMMPSVDRVGRYYPLTLATSLPLDVNPFQLSIAGRNWFEQSTEVMLTALDEQDFDMDVFDDRVMALGAVAGIAESGAVSSQFGFGSAWRIPLDTHARIVSVLPGLMHQLVLQRLGAYSLWWTAGSQFVEPSMLLTAALPVPHDFSALLNGDWRSGNWDECLQSARELDSVLDDSGDVEAGA